MYGCIYFAISQSLFKFVSEEPLTANFGQGLINHLVAFGGDDHFPTFEISCGV